MKLSKAEQEVVNDINDYYGDVIPTYDHFYIHPFSVYPNLTTNHIQKRKTIYKLYDKGVLKKSQVFEVYTFAEVTEDG